MGAGMGALEPYTPALTIELLTAIAVPMHMPLNSYIEFSGMC